MIFKQRMWMIPLAHWVGILSMGFAVWQVANGVSPWWLLVWFCGHLLGGIAVSVGLHRYFTHGAFETNRFWHTYLALYATLTVQGSPLGWAAAHMTHHVHSDLDGDPHYTGLDYLIWKRYRKVPMVMWRVKHLVSDPVLAFVHRYAVLVIAGWIALLLSVGWVTNTGALPLVFLYLAPLGSTHTVGGIHQVISHLGKVGGRDMPMLEWVLPAAGEWMHRYHHENGRAAKMGQKWWHLDYGWWFIKLVRK